jgi:hypothetical protein
MTYFDTAVDVVMRPSSYQPSATGAPWPKDPQGYTQIDHADTLEDYTRNNKQWTKHQVELTAPADRVSVMVELCCVMYQEAYRGLELTKFMAIPSRVPDVSYMLLTAIDLAQESQQGNCL